MAGIQAGAPSFASPIFSFLVALLCSRWLGLRGPLARSLVRLAASLLVPVSVFVVLPARPCFRFFGRAGLRFSVAFGSLFPLVWRSLWGRTYRPSLRFARGSGGCAASRSPPLASAFLFSLLGLALWFVRFVSSLAFGFPSPCSLLCGFFVCLSLLGAVGACAFFSFLGFRSGGSCFPSAVSFVLFFGVFRFLVLGFFCWGFCFCVRACPPPAGARIFAHLSFASLAPLSFASLSGFKVFTSPLP